MVSVTVPREHVAPCELFVGDPGLARYGLRAQRRCVVMASFSKHGEDWLVLADEMGIHALFESPAIFWEER